MPIMAEILSARNSKALKKIQTKKGIIKDQESPKHEILLQQNEQYGHRQKKSSTI